MSRRGSCCFTFQQFPINAVALNCNNQKSPERVQETDDTRLQFSTTTPVTVYCLNHQLKKKLLQSQIVVFSPFPIHTPSSRPLLLPNVCFLVFLSRLSCLGQSVTLSSMMEDLGISLQCYKGARRRSRPHSAARSACVFCQPKRSSKREVARRDSST